MRWAPLLLLLACTTEADRAEKRRECAQLDTDVRNAANKQGLPQQGICSNDLFDRRDLCNNLRTCLDELEDM
jgi:hypothetical protein